MSSRLLKSLSVPPGLVVATAVILSGCAAGPTGEDAAAVGGSAIGTPRVSGEVVQGRVSQAPETLGWPRGTARMVLPAAHEGAGGWASGLFVLDGQALGSTSLAPFDGLVIVDGQGRVLLENSAAVEWGTDLFILPAGARDVQGLLERAAAEGASVFQAPMLLDKGRELQGPGVETGPARRLTLYRDADGRLGVLDSGGHRRALRAHLDDLAALGAREAVALDPEGMPGFAWTLAGVAPIGERVAGYLTLDWAR